MLSHHDHFDVYDSAAACLHDEFSFEVPELGHGVFTYCFSVRKPNLNSVVAEAILPNNTFGPSLSIAEGHVGCSLMAAGAQNPIYYRSSSVLEVCGKKVKFLDENSKCAMSPTHGLIAQANGRRAVRICHKPDIGSEFSSPPALLDRPFSPQIPRTSLFSSSLLRQRGVICEPPHERFDVELTYES